MSDEAIKDQVKSSNPTPIGAGTKEAPQFISEVSDANSEAGDIEVRKEPEIQEPFVPADVSDHVTPVKQQPELTEEERSSGIADSPPFISSISQVNLNTSERMVKTHPWWHPKKWLGLLLKRQIEEERNG